MIRRCWTPIAPLLLLGAAVGNARADFGSLASPGPLAAPHAAFEKQCDKCHVPFLGIPAPNCLECHEHTAKEINSGTGLHAKMSYKKCSACHTDHKGRNRALSPPVEKDFDHAISGFRLDGRHAKTACASCHPTGANGPKWVGVPTTCKGCHGDSHHKGVLGDKCATCHNALDWLPPTHTVAQHKLPMTGKHAGIACAACHKSGAHMVAKASCGDCHEQKHGGTKAPCETCHTPADWKQATFTHDFCTCILPGKHQTAACLSCHPAFKFNPTPMECIGCHDKDRKHEPLGNCAKCHSALSWKNKKKFDHDKDVVGFPIEGKHNTVGCENCHTKPGIFRGAPRNCEGCHKVPKHGDFGPCAQCHAVSGFAPPKFSHEKTRFPLDGAHTGVACETCHAKFKKGSFQPGPTACVLCHGDPHKGQFHEPAKVESPQRPAGERFAGSIGFPHFAPDDGAGPPAAGHSVSRQWGCRDCHVSTGWKPSTVTGPDHGKFGFPLRAAHERVACARCHRNGQFVGTPRSCASCHLDQHRGRFGAACERCHVEEAWPKIHGFDHAADAGFALVGVHTSLSCAGCHGEDRQKLAGLASAPRPIGCASCHTPVHGNQFPGDCQTCHKPTRFTDVPPFAHAEKTGFPLERRHAAIRCTTCHDARRGEKLLAACTACHDGDPHRGALGQECGDCHRADRWLAVRFDHDRTEFALRGRHFVTQCAACHKNNQWTGLRGECVTCHARDRPSDGKHPTRWDCGSAGCHSPFGWHRFAH